MMFILLLLVFYWLSFLEGLFEVFPISASITHFQYFYIQRPSEGFFDFAFLSFVPLGILIAFIVYFRHDMVQLFQGLRYMLRRQWHHPQVQKLGYLILASLPTLIGILVIHIFNIPPPSKGPLIALDDPVIKADFSSSASTLKTELHLITYIGFSILIYIVDRVCPQRFQGVSTWRQALLIGLAEMSALAGASRLLMCIAAGRVLGLTRLAATRFAFLMAIPTLTMELGRIIFLGLKPQAIKVIIPGVSLLSFCLFLLFPVLAFLSSFFSLRWFIKWIGRDINTLSPLIVCRIALCLLSCLGSILR